MLIFHQFLFEIQTGLTAPDVIGLMGGVSRNVTQLQNKFYLRIQTKQIDEVSFPKCIIYKNTKSHKHIARHKTSIQSHKIVQMYSAVQ